MFSILSQSTRVYGPLAHGNGALQNGTASHQLISHFAGEREIAGHFLHQSIEVLFRGKMTVSRLNANRLQHLRESLKAPHSNQASASSLRNNDAAAILQARPSSNIPMMKVQ